MLHSRMELFTGENTHETLETDEKKGANYQDFQKNGTKNSDMIVVVKNRPASSIIPKEATSQEAPSKMFKVTDVSEKRKGIRTGKPSTTVRDADPLALKESAERKVRAVPKPILPRKTAKSIRSIEVLDQILAPKKSEKSRIERRFNTNMRSE
jgi:hypothetical protein